MASILKIARQLQKGELSSEAIVKQGFNVAQSFADYNLLIKHDKQDQCINEARESDKRRAAGKMKGDGLLEGISIAIKDNFCTDSFPSSCASNMLKDFTPPYNATVVEILKKNGAVIMGKTNMDEFGMGSDNRHSIYGAGHNPHHFDHVTGGSSGGSAGAVAAQIVCAAIGSDTGGSVRLPAAYCGVVGMKPTYGLFSRHGLIAYASSLDTPGIITSEVTDAQLLFDYLNQHDPRDPTSIPEDQRRKVQDNQFALEKIVANNEGLKGIMIGIPGEYCVSELDPEIQSKWEATINDLEKQGASIVDISLKSTKLLCDSHE